MPSDLNDDLSALENVEKIESQKKRVLERLLDELLLVKNQHIAIRGSMGRTLGTNGSTAISIPSYSVMHSMKWLSEPGNISMGFEMPFMKHAIDPETKRLIIDEESAETLAQRAPDWTRQPPLAVYLLQQPYRKFGTILAVISPDWVDDPDHENWGDDGRALKHSTNFRALDTAGNIGLIDLDGAKVYALDGQHRVMGIRGLSEISEHGLDIRKKDGTVTNKTIPRDTLLKRLGVTVTDLNHVLQEKLNVEYIPAVMAGETREEASKRVRMVFVALNEYAKSPDIGENILLDESDGYAIVARKIGHHAIFKTPEGESRVNWKNRSVGKKDPLHIITLKHLKEICEAYGEAHEYDWAHTEFRDTIPVRPPESELKFLKDTLDALLSELQSLRCFVDLNSGDELIKLREFPESAESKNRGHLLMRPVGLPIVVRAIAPLLKKNPDQLSVLIEKLKKYDSQGGFEAYKPQNVWFGVTYDFRKKTMLVTKADQKLASDLLTYLLVGATAEDRDELTKKVVAARTVEEGRWVDFHGEIKNIKISEIHLPEPIKVD